MKTKLEIIQETVTFYSEDTNRRAYNRYTMEAEYLSEGGKQDAVARYMIGGKHLEHKGSALDLFGTWGFNILQPYAMIKDEVFWLRVMLLHDRHQYWKAGSGMTNEGKNKVKELIERYK